MIGYKKDIIFIIVILITVLFPVSITLADTEVDPEASCNYSDYFEKLADYESSGDYTVMNGPGYLGRYQMGEYALIDAGYYTNDGNPGRNNWDPRKFTGKNGIFSKEDFLNNPEAQEEAVRAYNRKNWGYITNARLDDYIGQTIGGCEITESGLIGGYHLLGLGTQSNPGLRAFLESNGTEVGTDGNNTEISKYICGLGGYDTPFGETGSCDPNYVPPEGQQVAASVARAGGRVIRNVSKIYDHYVAALKFMTMQLTANMLHQVQIIGSFWDAKHQLETQRIFQTLQAEAHKDYHPGDQMCRIGTFSRDLAQSDARAQLTKLALSKHAIDRELVTGQPISLGGIREDYRFRLGLFIERFCNKADNGGGLEYLCKNSNPDPNQINRDIDFTRTLDLPLTLDIDFMDGTLTQDEENISAMMKYFYMHEPYAFIDDKKARNEEIFATPHFNRRSLTAMRTVARNSMVNFIAQKSAGPGNAGPYLKSLMREFGLPDDEIENILGRNPSYFAQMEILAKKIYMHPDFVTALYDKPANVQRVSAAMAAIKLMQDRDIHASLTRIEMLKSIWMEIKLRRQRKEELYPDIISAIVDE